MEWCTSDDDSHPWAPTENPDVVALYILTQRTTLSMVWCISDGRFASLGPHGKAWCLDMVYPRATRDPEYGVVYL